jgi:hypothetical protein
MSHIAVVPGGPAADLATSAYAPADATPRLLEIIGRVRADPTQVVSLDDFRLRETDADEDLCAIVAERPNVVPYCLDHANRRMIFAEIPPQIDLSKAPFYYQAQYEHATRLIALPYDSVHKIAARLPAGFGALIFIYSVGRCGSTLVSKLWGRLEDTYSISEPDVFAGINLLQGDGRLTDRETLELLGSTVRLLYREAAPRRRLVIKFRAQCIGLAPFIHALCPAATFLFLYRNAIDCIDSYMRVFGAIPLPEREFRQAFWYTQTQPDKYKALRWLGRPLLVWLVCAHSYLQLRERGVPFAALKYEDLVRSSRETVARMFAHCGATDAPVELACAAMNEDSQAGTPLARNADGRRTLTTEDAAFIRGFFAEHGGLAPDHVLDGTLECRA